MGPCMEYSSPPSASDRWALSMSQNWIACEGTGTSFAQVCVPCRLRSILAATVLLLPKSRSGRASWKSLQREDLWNIVEDASEQYLGCGRGRRLVASFRAYRVSCNASVTVVNTVPVEAESS